MRALPTVGALVESVKRLDSNRETRLRADAVRLLRQLGFSIVETGHGWVVAGSIDDVQRALAAIGIEFINIEEAAE
jgi:hypothetical protein